MLQRFLAMTPLHRHSTLVRLCVQVSVLSEGYQLYFGAPKHVQPWFSKALSYPYQADSDGAVSDWLMDLVSIGFSKPQARFRRCASMPVHA